MKILVKKFCLAHEGQIYKAGDVVEIADETLAKRLLARAHGDMEVYCGQEVLDADDGEATQNATDEESNMSDPDAGGTELPALDPAAVVQTNESKAKSKAK